VRTAALYVRSRPQKNQRLRTPPANYSMPFKSQKQRRWMFKFKPKMAKKWAKETPKGKKLPKKKSKANEAKQTLIDIIREELEAYVREQRDGK